MKLEGQVIIVTGGASGIGLEACGALAREGAQLIVADYDLEERVEGMYELVERAAGESLQDLLSQAHAIPQTRVAAHSDSTLLRATIAQLLEEAAKDRAAIEKMDLLAPASTR